MPLSKDVLGHRWPTGGVTIYFSASDEFQVILSLSSFRATRIIVISGYTQSSIIIILLVTKCPPKDCRNHGVSIHSKYFKFENTYKRFVLHIFYMICLKKNNVIMHHQQS